MFDNPEEEPIPIWPAISRLLEDYGFSKNEDVPANIYYRRVSWQWSVIPPAAVSGHPHYCPCPRRHKWNPVAKLSSIEYNWPIIQGPKATSKDCHLTYKRLFEHLDPVCYWATVFSNVLAN